MAYRLLYPLPMLGCGSSKNTSRTRWVYVGSLLIAFVGCGRQPIANLDIDPYEEDANIGSIEAYVSTCQFGCVCYPADMDEAAAVHLKLADVCLAAGVSTADFLTKRCQSACETTYPQAANVVSELLDEDSCVALEPLTPC